MFDEKSLRVVLAYTHPNNSIDAVRARLLCLPHLFKR